MTEEVKLVAILFYYLTCMILGLLSNGKTESTFVTIICIALYSLILLFAISRDYILNQYAFPLIMGYVFRIFFLFFDTFGRNIYQLPNAVGDSNMYKSAAISFSQGIYSERGGMFGRVIGSLMKVTGPNVLFAQYTILMFSMISLVFLIKTLMLFDEIEFSIKYQTVMLICILPNFAILSIAFLRESIITMFLAISFYFFVRWLRGYSFFDFLLAFVFAFVASAFHGGSSAVVVGYIGVLLIYDHENLRIHIQGKNLIPVIAVVIIFGYIFTRYSDVFFSKINNVSSLEEIANTSYEGGSSYARFVGNSNSLGNMIIFTIPRILYFLFSPFPWQWRSLGDVIAFLFSSLFYVLTIRNAVYQLKQNGSLVNYIFPISFVSLTTAFVFAWGVSNTGTATRHRDKMIIFYAVLYALSKQSAFENVINISDKNFK